MVTTCGPDDYSDLQGQSIAKAIWDTYHTGVLPTAADILTKVKGISMDLVSSLVTNGFGANSAEGFAKQVRKDSTMRRFHERLKGIARLEEPEEAITALQELAGSMAKGVNPHRIQTMEEICAEVWNELEASAMVGENGLIGLSTGLSEYDKVTGGLHPAELTVIAARPAMGKTAFALKIAETIARTGRAVGILSLEMGKRQLAKRMLSAESGVDGWAMTTGSVDEKDWERLAAAVGPLSSLPLYIDDTGGVTLSHIKTQAQKLKAEHDIGVLLIDFLQLVSDPTTKNSRAQEVGAIAYGCKAIAKALNIPVVALSQLSRNVELSEDRRPSLSHLKESGDIEAAADVVCFLYRREYYFPNETKCKGIAELIIAKHRNGPCGTIEVGWDGAHTRFIDLERAKGRKK